jgi:hypothetical protein
MVVRRAWLQKQYPEFWQEHLKSETKAFEVNRNKLVARIEEWKKDYDGDDAEVIGDFLDNNVKLLGLNEAVDPSKFAFTVLNLSSERIRRPWIQSPDRHRLAGIAWSENIDGVETANASVLKRELEKRNVDLDGYSLKLGNEMPPMLESDTDWEARKALIEFALLERVEYQGTGEMFFRRGENANPMQAMQAMMQNGGLGGFSQIDKLGRELGLPEFQNRKSNENSDAWIKPMIEAAEKANRRSFSVSRMEPGDPVKVETSLYYKAMDGRWYPLATFANSERLRDQSADELDALKEDPQVARVMDIAKQFGLADPSLLDQAIRNGAATRKALEKSMSDLETYVEQYSFEIDNPPIEIGARK